MSRIVFIQGSSRSDGDTNTLVEFVRQKLDGDLVDLNTKNISPFDYEFKNRDDDFFPLINDLIDNYDHFVFASPVYWYSMSGIMKNFFDRISDLLIIEKDTGRKLRGKKMSVLSCSNGNDIYPSFYVPFEKSAGYLGMEYIASCHGYVREDRIPEEVQGALEIFSSKLIDSV